MRGIREHDLPHWARFRAKSAEIGSGGGDGIMTEHEPALVGLEALDRLQLSRPAPIRPALAGR
jgi:hypothetical protein